ncbi:YezD family protein [Faecalicatena contorta]|nr:YezD family protein [Faecalicatena contorta]MCF2681835.1 YezD family protein [Faecalicatena contorta]
MADEQKNDEYIKLLQQMIKELRFGSITLVIQDSKIVQIQKEEKIRI